MDIAMSGVELFEMDTKGQALVGSPTLERADARHDVGDFYACCGGNGENFALRQIVGSACILLITSVFAIMDQSKEGEEEIKKHRCLGVLLVVIVLWLCEVLPIPITGLLVGPMLFLVEIYSLKDALSGYMANLTLILFGSYFIAIAMERHGLDRRLANFTTSLPFVKGSAWRERLALMGSGWLMSMWVSNTGATNILTPILLKSQGAQRGNPFPPSPKRSAVVGGLLAVAYGCNAGGMGTLVGTPPNLVAANLLLEAGVNIDFVTWMLIGVPASLLAASFAFLVLFAIYKPVERNMSEESPSAEVAASDDEEHKPQGPMTWGEKVVMTCFLVTIFFWLFPSMYKLAGFENHQEVKDKLPAGAVVIFGTMPMCLIPDSDWRKRVLPWSEAKKADWGIIMLVGGGVTLGRAVLDTGVAQDIAEAIIYATGVNDRWTLTFLVIFITIFATEVTSNTATTNIMVPIVLAISKSIDPDPLAAVAPVIGVAFAASCAFMMPIATPPNYIVMDTGHLAVSDMIRAGIIVNFTCCVVLWAVLRVLVPLIYG